MKTNYEAPLAEVIDFTAKEHIAVIDKEESVGPQPEAGVGSKDL